MQTTIYEVKAKWRPAGATIASIADFDLGRGIKQRDAGYLLKSRAIMPYCIHPKTGEMLLAQVPDDIDVTASPFVYEAQRRHATHVHAMDLNLFLELASECSTPGKALFVHSTGRCGSTLLAKALGGVRGIETISEPDIFSQIATMGLSGGEMEKITALLHKACMQFWLRDRQGLTVVKFRSAVCEQADIIASTWPQAANLFLYRNAVAVAWSYARMMGRSIVDWTLSGPDLDAWSRLVPFVRRMHAPMSGYDLLAAMWGGPVTKYLDIAPQRMWLGALRYETLIASPQGTLAALLALLGKQFYGRELPDDVFATHSQSGTYLDPQRRQDDSEFATDVPPLGFAEKIQQSLLSIDKGLDPDLILPGDIPSGPVPFAVL